MTRDEFYAMPCIADCFPLTFESGKQRWDNFSTYCKRCDRVVPKSDTRGYVVPQTRAVGYREAPTIVAYHVSAQTLCCNSLTRCDYTLHENMTVTGRHPKTGAESLWNMVRPTLWERLTERVRSWFSR